MKKVTRYTRAKQSGKIIYCPKCNNHTRVYHFSWSAITCNDCDTMIDKYDWLLEPRQFRSNQGRNPEKNIEIYKLITVAIIGLFAIICYLILKQV